MTTFPVEGTGSWAIMRSGWQHIDVNKKDLLVSLLFSAWPYYIRPRPGSFLLSLHVVCVALERMTPERMKRSKSEKKLAFSYPSHTIIHVAPAPLLLDHLVNDQLVLELLLLLSALSEDLFALNFGHMEKPLGL